MADELGTIEAELLPFKAKIKRAEGLRAAIRGAFKDSPAGESFRVDGAKWSALLGPKGSESVIDSSTLLELVGAPAFVAIASVSLKAIQENCAPEVLGAVVTTQMSGSRSLTLAAVVAPAAPPAPPVKAPKRGKK